MQAFVVEIETPSGRRIRKGVLSLDVDSAVRDIRHMQTVFGTNGLRKCPMGEVVGCEKRQAGKPFPPGLLRNPKAVEILTVLNLRV